MALCLTKPICDRFIFLRASENRFRFRERSTATKQEHNQQDDDHMVARYRPNIFAIKKITIAPKMPPPPSKYMSEYPAAANNGGKSMIVPIS
jgi:hypothetical protein